MIGLAQRFKDRICISSFNLVYKVTLEGESRATKLWKEPFKEAPLS